ncbi:hypothetical protein LSM04_004848 [Trypanosoma melophagium]|uniref:uncharacterized protein n=1 Tax=Trypanosoma melophagium TaxID=715481 RepID=UPI00351A3E32|nr:hypothetical protein LSM04_004848 [Trypanosoma melophagium]
MLNLIQQLLEIKVSGWMIKEAWLNLVTALSSPNLSLHQLHIITSLFLLFLPKMLYQYKEAMCESITLLIGSLLKIATDAYSLSLLQTYFPSAWISSAGVDETFSSLFSH